MLGYDHAINTLKFARGMHETVKIKNMREYFIEQAKEVGLLKNS